jgi:cyclopropane fatty-acyl-phospholipid synthase-like methyltransferase
MPNSSPPPSSGSQEKADRVTVGLVDPNWDDYFWWHAECSTCGGSFFLHTIRDRAPELSCGCSGTKLTYFRV